MNQAKPKIRLFVPAPLIAGQLVTLDQKQAHYLSNVMRLEVGDAIAVFNGSDGEWLAGIVATGKKDATLRLEQKLAAQTHTPDLWLAFAPVKNKTDLIVEKATELGVSRILTVVTRHGVVKSINMEKLTAHAVEAAEQCGRHDVPEITTYDTLSNMLGTWSKDRILLYGDESGAGVPLKTLLPQLSKGKYAVLVGPEGGFAVEEHRMLKSMPSVKAFCMGPRILRADTAAVAALACVQAWLGDWEVKPEFEAVG
jgi:16S rRNA (uracil1498-N3)-methyltransferase